MIVLLATSLLLASPLQRHTPDARPSRVPGGTLRLVFAPASAKYHVDDDLLGEVRSLLERRIVTAGISGSVTTTAGEPTGRIVVEASGISDPNALMLLGGVGRVQLRVLDSLRRFDSHLDQIDSLLRKAGAEQVESGPSGGGDLGQVFGRALSQGDSQAQATRGELRELVFPGLMPGELLVLPERAARVDTLLRDLAQLNALPDVDLVWGSSLVKSSLGWYYPLYTIDRRPLVGTEDLAGASTRPAPENDSWVLRLRVGFRQRRLLCDATGRLTGEHFVLVVDNVVIGRPAAVEGALCDGAVEMETGEARAVAAAITSGPLPVPLVVVKSTLEPARSHHAPTVLVIGAVVVLASLYFAILLAFTRRRAPS